MPQQPSSEAPQVFAHALGINDRESVLKLQPGFIPAAVNLMASNDTYDRREGRDMSFLVDGSAVLGIAVLTWSDGTISEVVQFGSALYDMSATFTYLVKAGVKLYIQSANGSYWNCTPDSTTGLITPSDSVVPTATPQAANFTVANGETFGFDLSSTATMQLDANLDRGGWFLNGVGGSFGATLITTDMVFTVASGFSFRITDYTGNTWSLSMSNDGDLLATS